MNMSALDELAKRHGIALTLERLDGVVSDVSEASKRHVLGALGIETEDPDAVAAALRDAAGLEPPRLEAPDEARCHLPDWLHESPAWGISVQLYELRSARNWGIGDFTDLETIAETCARAGADFIGLNPLHSLFLADPDRCSPFSPSNRRFLNPAYIAVDAIPGYSPEMAKAYPLADLRNADLVDYAAVVRAKLGALRAVHAAWKKEADISGPYSPEAFDRFKADGGEPLRLHALFEAISGRMVEDGNGSGWHAWPQNLHDKNGADVSVFASRNAEDVEFHSWLQWVTSLQLRQASDRARAAGMRIGLYFDLAVGEAPDGSASWSDPSVAVPGVTIGAPPDFFTANGQDWGLAPASPEALAGNDASKFRSMMDVAMEGAGALRIDHVMALWQLFLVPQEKSPADGVYLRYPITDLLRVLAECSQRHETIVIGEDLGNVPRGFREVMQQVNVLSYRILYFEQDKKGFIPPDAYPELALACLSTHDLPTLRGWWRGDDVGLRHRHGLIEREAEQLQAAERRAQRKTLLKALQRAGVMDETKGRPANKASGQAADISKAAVVAAHRYIARTPCLLAGARLADLVGEVTPTNLPGTASEYPNWRPKLAVPIEDLEHHELFRSICAAIAAERPRPS